MIFCLGTNLLLQIFAAFIIWAIVVATFFVLISANSYVSLKAGVFLIWDISNVTKAVQSQAEEIAADSADNDVDVSELLASGDAENIVYWKFGSYALTVLVVLYVCAYTSKPPMLVILEGFLETACVYSLRDLQPQEDRSLHHHHQGSWCVYARRRRCHVRPVLYLLLAAGYDALLRVFHHDDQDLRFLHCLRPGKCGGLGCC